MARLGATALTDQDGRPLRMADFYGKLVILSFFFTSCPSVCPRGAQALSEVQRRLPNALQERVRFLSLSVDPENDTPDALKRFALANGADLTRWSFARAEPADTPALLTELGAFDPRASGQATPSSHATAVYLFDTDGQLMQRYASSPLDVARLARELEQLDASPQSEKVGD